MHFLLLLAQNLPTELQVCPHPQTTGLVCLGAKPQVDWQSARLKSCYCKQEGHQPSLVALFNAVNSLALKVLLLCIDFSPTEAVILDIDLNIVDLKVDLKNLKLLS